MSCFLENKKSIINNYPDIMEIKALSNNIKKRYQLLINEGFDINSLEPCIKQFISSKKIDNQLFYQVISLSNEKRELFFLLSNCNYSNCQNIIDSFYYMDTLELDFVSLKDIISAYLKEGFDINDILKLF